MNQKRWVALLVICCIVGSFYCLSPKLYHVSIPVELGDANTPYAVIDIQGVPYQLEFDLGSKFPISLRQHLVEQIRYKTNGGMGTWKDMRGSAYQAPTYLVKNVKLGGLPLGELEIQQEDDDYICNTLLWDKKKRSREEILSNEKGTIGRPLLNKVNLLMDFSRLTLYASNNFKALQADGYEVEKWTQVPFEVGRPGIIVKIQTEWGPKCLVLDSGSSLNLLRHLENLPGTQGQYGFSFVTCAAGVIGNTQVDSLTFHLFPLTEELTEIDGYLGMPFLKKYPIYIDYPHRLLYIDLSKKTTL